MRATTARPADVLRVATYNTADFTRDRRKAANVVREMAPDVLCLQEVPRRFLPTTAAALFADACGLFVSGPVWGSGGTVVLAGPRVRVRRSVVGRLPVPLGQRRRGYAAVVLELPGAPVITPCVVVSVHLGLDESQRVRHLEQVLREVPDACGRATAAPLVVAGDLNEVPGKPVQRLLDARFERADDARATFPADDPRSAIDTIRVTPGTPVVAHGGSDASDAELALASDHRPLWADLRVNQTSLSR